MYVQSLEYHSTLRSRRSWGDWDLLRILMFLTMLTFFSLSCCPLVLLYSTLTLDSFFNASFLPLRYLDGPSDLFIFSFSESCDDSCCFFLQTWNPPIFTCPLSPSQCLGPLSAPAPEDPALASPPPPPADSLPLVSRSRFSRSYRSLSCDEKWNVKISCQTDKTISRLCYFYDFIYAWKKEGIRQLIFGVSNYQLTTVHTAYSVIGYSAKSDIVSTLGWYGIPYANNYWI